MTARRFSLFLAGFFALWTVAWLKHNLLVETFGWWSAGNHGAELAYWAAAKFVVWVVYPWLFWRRHVTDFLAFTGLDRTTLAAGYRWGGVAAVIWAIASIVIGTHLQGMHVRLPTITSTFVYVITLTPIFEEIFFRGFVVSGFLALRVEGKIANVLTTILFLLVHVVGWSFQHTLQANIHSGVWVGIVVVSLVAGFIRIRPP